MHGMEGPAKLRLTWNSVLPLESALLVLFSRVQVLEAALHTICHMLFGSIWSGGGLGRLGSVCAVTDHNFLDAIC